MCLRAPPSATCSLDLASWGRAAEGVPVDSTLALAQCLAGGTLPVSICCQDWQEVSGEIHTSEQGLMENRGNIAVLPVADSRKRHREINAREGERAAARGPSYICTLSVQSGDSSLLASEPQGTACPNRACKDLPGSAKAEGQLPAFTGPLHVDFGGEERRWARPLSPKGCACPPDRSSIRKPMDRASLQVQEIQDYETTLQLSHHQRALLLLKYKFPKYPHSSTISTA